jgi:hypothetical protein
MFGACFASPCEVTHSASSTNVRARTVSRVLLQNHRQATCGLGLRSTNNEATLTRACRVIVSTLSLVECERGIGASVAKTAESGRSSC